MMVLAAARLPSNRSVSASSAARSTVGSLRWPMGSDACCAQSRICAVGLSGSASRAGLKACWYKAVRSSREPGRPCPPGRVSAGVTVASASATLAREWAARDGHFITVYAVASSYQLTTAGSGDVPFRRLAGQRIKLQAHPGRADQLGPVAVGELPGDERLRPAAACCLPADLERSAAAGASADRVHAYIEPVHGCLLSRRRPVPSRFSHPKQAHPAQHVELRHALVNPREFHLCLQSFAPTIGRLQCWYLAVVATADEVARLAGECPIIRRAIVLAAWVGPEGKALTRVGVLRKPAV